MAEVKEVAFCNQLLLASFSIGFEMCSAFSHVFPVLLLQFLGVPVSMVSISGVFGGCLTIVLLPFVGRFTDSGTNHLRRKLLSMILGLFLFLITLGGIAVCGIMKIYSSDEYMGGSELNTTQYESHPHNLTTTSKILILTTAEFEDAILYNETKTLTSTAVPGASEDSNVRIRIYLAIVFFIFLDATMELFNSVTRVFVLECLPPINHRNALLLITSIGSISGMLFAFICTFDLPGILQSWFHYDGTAVLVVFLPTVLAFVITTTFICSMATGYILKRAQGATLFEQIISVNEETPNKKETPMMIKSHDGDSQKQHLFAGKTNARLLKKPYYQAIGKETAKTQRQDVADDVDMHGESVVNATVDEKHKFLRETSSLGGQNLTVDEQHGTSVGSSQLQEAESMASHEKSTAADDIGRVQDKRHKWWRIDKRYIIVFVAMFFVTGAMECVQIYMPNAVTRDIYHGDPTAPPGTEARMNYDKGLRRAATGSLIMFISFALSSLGLKKIVHVIGENALFLVIQVAFIACVVSVLLTRNETTYFLSMAGNGLIRICTHAIMYLKITAILQDNEHASMGDDHRGNTSSKNTGTAMTFVYLCKPAHYMVLSMLMGPLLDSTGNVWVPIIYALVSSCLALLTYPLLFLVKPK